MPIKTTCELEYYIKTLYEKIKPYAEIEQIYQPISTHFAKTTPNNYPGSFCYSDEKNYFYGGVGDRGAVTIEKANNEFEVAYWVFKFHISEIAFDYEKKHRIEGQDIRRIAFQKYLELMEIIGEEYIEQAKKEIDEILERHPFHDELL